MLFGMLFADFSDTLKLQFAVGHAVCPRLQMFRGCKIDTAQLLAAGWYWQLLLAAHETRGQGQGAGDRGGRPVANAKGMRGEMKETRKCKLQSTNCLAASATSLICD
jgi:hypothetical protein